uniref:Smr domain-containing protein n=2 Tax=Opuntia streptacantha TaxID=393608 RepID=A0A7C9AQ54_OPUST
MSSSKQESPTGETKLSTLKRGTSLNPNAAEFIPFSYRGPSTTSSISDVAAKFPASGSSGNHVLDRSKSSVSTNSDEEAHQYWQCQLPDDITPDFKVMGEEESLEVGNLSFAALSLHDSNEAHRFSTSVGTGYLFNEQLDASSHHANGGSVLDKMRYSNPSYGIDLSSPTYLHKTSKPWEMHVLGAGNHVENERVGSSFDESLRLRCPSDMGGQSSMFENNSVNPVDFLASQFPGFAAESLAEVYFASGCDLNLTIEMLTQLELQVDGAFNQNINSKTLSAPNLTSMDFPALPVPDNKANLPKDGLLQTANPYGSGKDNMLLFKSGSSLTAKGASDFASAVRKQASQDAGLWNYDRNSSADVTIGSSRSSRPISASYNSGAAKNAYIDRLQGRGSARAAPVWLETGDAVADLYSELREDARDHARIRNAYFEQARQAYLIGNKALAKELSVKGQLHNMQMKAAHNQAQESIYRQRNPINPEQACGRGQEKMIDLHGLHVSEAIHVLRHELSVLSKAARSAEQRLYVYICVGTGHHTKGSRTPARLPVAVQRYLLEEEGLEYTEPQPGLLRVVLY